MIKRSSSRNQRSKGIKVKHVLQIILLLGVCFWLIYQVKRSHDKKKEFDQTDAKGSVVTQNAYQTPKIHARKFLPDEDKVNQDEKHREEEEDETIVEDEDKLEHEEERNDHESEQKPGLRGAGEDQAEDENKSEETEDERGAGDDEIDENDQDKPDVDADRDDEFMEEDKEGDDEKEGSEDSEDEGKEASLENHNSHEAREENYKGDDASSAVTHDTHTTTAETETATLENSDAIVNSEMSITKSENKPNYTEDSNRNQPGSDFKITEVKLTDETSSNATSVKETGDASVSNPVDSSNLNNISMTSSGNHSEASGNLTVVIPGASNNMTVTNTSSEHNKVEMFSESSLAQNGTVNITVTEDAKNVQTEGFEQVGNSISEENRPISNSTVPVKTENGAASGADSSNVEGGDIDKATRFVAYNETENKGNSEMSEISKTQNNSYVKENTGATKDEEFNFKGTTQISDSSSANGTFDSVEHHVTDSLILKEVTEVRTDPDRLPDIRNVGDNGDAAATT
ncbi:uncharacterized protein LOC130741427 [Lotus japonicus]|uniref:uncharacterized protein LOC130741427 n=1 Tax=Lotus japonicus TaxID=34305 RepID=UPI00258AA3A2|nr:uncharacterized protein LOC130741427 [Lotus japonicus]